LRWMSAQAGVQRSVPRRDSGDSDGGRSAGLVRVEETTLQPTGGTVRSTRRCLGCQPGLPSFARATAPSGTRSNNRDAVTLAGQRRDALVDGR